MRSVHFTNIELIFGFELYVIIVSVYTYAIGAFTKYSLNLLAMRASSSHTSPLHIIWSKKFLSSLRIELSTLQVFFLHPHEQKLFVFHSIILFNCMFVITFTNFIHHLYGRMECRRNFLEHSIHRKRNHTSIIECMFIVYAI